MFAGTAREASSRRSISLAGRALRNARSNAALSSPSARSAAKAPDTLLATGGRTLGNSRLEDYLLFLQEQIKGIIIIVRLQVVHRPASLFGGGRLLLLVVLLLRLGMVLGVKRDLEIDLQGANQFGKYSDSSTGSNPHTVPSWRTTSSSSPSVATPHLTYTYTCMYVHIIHTYIHTYIHMYSLILSLILSLLVSVYSSSVSLILSLLSSLYSLSVLVSIL